MDWEGREFLKPIYFLNAILKEFGYFYSVIFSIFGTGIFGILFSNWSNIWYSLTNFLSKYV
jgi:hypothetical protein